MKRYCVIFLIILTSCNEKIFTGDVDCDQCFEEKQGKADLVIDLTISNKYPAVPVTVYSGDVEDDKVVMIDTAFNTPFYVYVPVGKKYSVKAEYKSRDRIIYAVDGTNLKELKVTDACDITCYVIENEYMDARLKSDNP